MVGGQDDLTHRKPRVYPNLPDRSVAQAQVSQPHNAGQSQILTASLTASLFKTMSTIRPFPKPFAVELLSMIVKEVAGNDQGVWRETLKNLSLVGSVLEGPAQKLLLGKVAVFEGNDDLSDEVDNAFYGIEVQNHGVTDPSQEVKFRGFNRWCAEIRDPDPDPNSFRHGPPSYFSTIKYTRGGNCDVIPGARSEKYLLAFTKVKKLRLEKVVLDPLEDPRYMPRFGACLGGQIRTLILKNCQMDINRFVCYLSLFPCLTSLRIDHPVITDADWILPDQPLPKFNENLQLDLPATGAVEFLRVLNNSDACLDMNYSQITINYTGSHPIPHHTKDFLSKSSHSLTHLQIDCESTLHHIWRMTVKRNSISS